MRQEALEVEALQKPNTRLAGVKMRLLIATRISSFTKKQVTKTIINGDGFRESQLSGEPLPLSCQVSVPPIMG